MARMPDFEDCIANFDSWEWRKAGTPPPKPKQVAGSRKNPVTEVDHEIQNAAEELDKALWSKAFFPNQRIKAAEVVDAEWVDNDSGKLGPDVPKIP